MGEFRVLKVGDRVWMKSPSQSDFWRRPVRVCWAGEAHAHLDGGFVSKQGSGVVMGPDGGGFVVGFLYEAPIIGKDPKDEARHEHLLSRVRQALGDQEPEMVGAIAELA